MRGRRVQLGKRSELADLLKQLVPVGAVVQAIMLWKARFIGRFRFGVLGQTDVSPFMRVLLEADRPVFNSRAL